MNIEEAKSLTRKAAIAGLVWGAIILTGLIMNPGFNANFFSLILVLAASYGIYKHSRFASVVMLLYFLMTLGIALLAYFVKFGILNNLLLFIGAILFIGGFIFYFVQGIRGTFAHFALVYEGNNTDSEIEIQKK